MRYIASLFFVMGFIAHLFFVGGVDKGAKAIPGLGPFLDGPNSHHILKARRPKKSWNRKYR
jgi:hypothetical protein